MRRIIAIAIAVIMMLSVACCASAEEFRVGLECNYAPFNWTQLEEENGVVHAAPVYEEPDDQISMLDLRSQQVCDALSAISVETLTPIEAMNELYKLKKMLN